MKNIKIVIIIAITCSILQSCEKEKINVQQIDGYMFSYNPKSNSLNNSIDAVYSAVNRNLENVAIANNEKTYKAYARKDKNGNIIIPKIANTEYMLAFNQKEYDEVTSNATIFDQNPENLVDFSKEFVFVLIHPSKFISSLQFYDGLDAYVEDENTILLKPSFTGLPYIQNENPILNYDEYNFQVRLYKIPKSKFQTINIEWETGETETVKIGK